MEVCSFVSGLLGNNCYIVDSEGEAMVVDVPMDSANVVIEYLKKNDLKLKYVLLTHGHYDHIAEAGYLAKETGAELMIHASEKEMLEDMDLHKRLFAWAEDGFFAKFVPYAADILLSHGDIVTLGSDKFEIRHTPGHTTGGLCIVHHDSKTVFVGDTLFDGSIGRTDLPGGDLKQLINSIKENLLDLDNDFLVLTGHGDKTTIGNEKQTNMYIA